MDSVSQLLEEINTDDLIIVPYDEEYDGDFDE